MVAIGVFWLSKLRHVRLWAAVFVSASAGVLVICTFLLPGTSIPSAFVWAAFGLTFPVVGAALLPAALEAHGGARFRDFAPRREEVSLYWRRARERVPPAVAVVIAVIFVLGWLAGMTAFFQLSGGLPERHGDHYVRDDHGVMTTLTRAEYEHQLTAWYRAFSAVSMGLCTIAAGLVLADPLRPDGKDTRP